MCDNCNGTISAPSTVHNIQVTVDSAYSEQQKALLKKRGRRKWIAFEQNKKLLSLNSTLYKQYERSLSCGSILAKYPDGNVRTWYCGKRWCTVCSAIKSAELQAGYQKSVDKMEEPYHVVLTIPNVKAPELHESIKKMVATFRLIKDRLRKQKMPLYGIRSFESTYNVKEDTFHPHFHILMDGEIEARAIHHYWMQHYPEASERGQQIDKADSNSLPELTKYVTKSIYNGKFYPEATDVINRALQGIRTFQTYGGMVKCQQEAEEPIEPTGEPVYYTWRGNNWYNSDGEPIVKTEYSEAIKKLIKHIRIAPLIRAG